MRFARYAVAAAVVLPLSACGGKTTPPMVQDVPAQENAPALQPVQINAVMGRIAENLAAADTSGNPDDAHGRLADVALETRQRTYQVRAGFPQRQAPPPLGGKRLADIVPALGEWPRIAMTATKLDGQTAPVIHVVRQENVRAPYQEIAAAWLLPEKTLPSVKSGKIGVAQLDPGDGAGLKVAPRAALEQWGDILSKGPGSPHLAEFGGNKFYDQIAREQTGEREAATTACPDCFEYEIKHTARPDKVWAMQTADGGALVVGVLDGVRSFKVNKEGAVLPLDGEIKAVAGKDKASDHLVITSTEVMAIVVPPEKSDAKIEVIGVDRTLMRVDAS